METGLVLTVSEPVLTVGKLGSTAIGLVADLRSADAGLSRGGSGVDDACSVLLIDDDERLLALARLALTKDGLLVETAPTASTGLAMALERTFDLVVLDIVLPDLSGWETLRRLRCHSNVPVMVLTGRDSDVDKARGLDLGADDYVTKPFSFLEFEARVRALLRRTRYWNGAASQPASARR